MPEENCPKEPQILLNRSNMEAFSLEQSPVGHDFAVYCGARQRGGSLSKRGLAESVISTAIKNAFWHGINLHLGTPNNADGNCIFESVADNISSRSCFGGTIIGTADNQRKMWLK